jgi:ribonuclease HI
MSVPAPHFLLYSEAAAAAGAEQALPGRWRFVLRPAAGGEAIQAADDEDGATPERLELLAIVRALEALDQPSRVTLVTGNRNVRRGLRHGLPVWRENSWQWERYGQMTPVKNGDLWRRIDRALEIHTLECRAGQLEKTHDLSPPPAAAAPPAAEPRVVTRRTRRGRVLRIDQPAAASPEYTPKRQRLVPTLRVGTPASPLRGLVAWAKLMMLQATALQQRIAWALQSPRRRASGSLRPTRSVGRR